MNYTKIDKTEPNLLKLLDEAPIYQKRIKVKFRRAMAGEIIHCFSLERGHEKTFCAEEGDLIATTLCGVQFSLIEYLTSIDEGPEGAFISFGFVKAIENPFGSPIEINIPKKHYPFNIEWDKIQFGNKDCFIVDNCDINRVRDGRPYLIDKDVFELTYNKL
jgi:hypothetical protein